MKQKIVKFDTTAPFGCHNCKHINVSMVEEPCNECLDNPAKEDSRKPVKWEEAETANLSTKGDAKE